MPAVGPENRIAHLMKAEQQRFLAGEMAQRGLTAADVAKKLELGASVQTKDDLNNMPLIRSELGSFS